MADLITAAIVILSSRLGPGEFHDCLHVPRHVHIDVITTCLFMGTNPWGIADFTFSVFALV